MILLNGKKTAEKIKEGLKKQAANLEKKPHLAAVLVGDHGASKTYVNAKIKACKEVSFESTLVKLPQTITQETLLEKIQELNENKEIDGFIVQLPLPLHINEKEILMHIHPQKDIDGFHPVNVGKMVLEMPAFLPATPYGILKLLEHYKVPISGKKVVVIGRSAIVGRPMSILLSQKRNVGNATVTLVHRHTENLESITKQADIIIAALGCPYFLKANMVKQGVAVIDVGISRLEKGYLAGDVDFEKVAPKCSFITPVPGGVGPMTIAMLLKNTLQAALHKF